MDANTEPRGLIHNPKFLQVSLLTLLGAAALLVFLLGRAQEERDALRREVEALRIAKKARLTLLDVVRAKPEPLRREVLLAFLRAIYPGADGFERKAVPSGETYFEVRRGPDAVGFAYYYEHDIDCGVCADMEILIGVDLEGKICGFSTVKPLDESPEAKERVSDWMKRYVEVSLADQHKLIGGFQPVARATKTSHQLFEGVLETLRKLSQKHPR